MNKKIEKTKKSLLKAFCKLTENTPVNELTVSQLCREAGVNRTTFYKYYAVPTDVIMEAAQQLILESIKTKQVISKEDLYNCMVQVCTQWYENRELLFVYLRSSGDLMMLLYKLISTQKDMLAFLQSKENNFISGGITAVAMQWLIGGCKQPIQSLAKDLTDYILRFQTDKN